MDFSKLQQKLIRRLTSPVEWVYVIHAHWFIILAVMSIIALMVFGEVTSKAPLYEAHMTLILETNDPVLDSDRRRGGNSRDFISDQVEIMGSETVLRRFVRSRGYGDVSDDDPDDVPDQKAIQASEEGLGVVQKAYRRFREFAKTILGRLRIPAVGSPEEQQEEEAVKDFRDRIQVQTSKRSSRVVLSVYGTTRDTLKQDLELWIHCYKLHLEDLASYRDAYLEKAKEEQRKRIELAQGKLDKFKEEHPDINKMKYERDSVELDYQRIRGAVDLPVSGAPRLPGRPVLPGAPPVAGEQQEKLQYLQDARKSYEKQLIELEAGGAPESWRANDYRHRLKWVEAEIKKIQGAPVPNPKPAEEIFDDHPAREKPDSEEVARKAEQRRSEEQERLLRRLVYLDELLDEWNRLKTDLNNLHGELVKLEQMSDLSFQLNEKYKSIRIKEEGQPIVSIDPVNQGFDRLVKYVGMATCGGLGLGVAIAFLLELFNRKIRFKKDVIDDLELEVIGVLPEK